MLLDNSRLASDFLWNLTELMAILQAYSFFLNELIREATWVDVAFVKPFFFVIIITSSTSW